MTDDRSKRTETVSSYNDLRVYQEALTLAVDIHKRVKSFPTDERFRVVDQLCRSSASVGAQIAEGWGRKASTAEFKRYMRMALGEVQETKYWIEFSTKLDYFPADEGRTWWKRYDELAAQMYRATENWS